MADRFIFVNRGVGSSCGSASTDSAAQRLCHFAELVLRTETGDRAAHDKYIIDAVAVFQKASLKHIFDTLSFNINQDQPSLQLFQPIQLINTTQPSTCNSPLLPSLLPSLPSQLLHLPATLAPLPARFARARSTPTRQTVSLPASIVYRYIELTSNFRC